MAPLTEKDLERVEISPAPAARELPARLSPKDEAGDPLDSPLPSPAVAAAPRPSKPQLSAAMIIPVWIALSSAVIIYNNYIYNTIGFKYPVFLVTWHLTFAVSPGTPCPALCMSFADAALAARRPSARACWRARRTSSTAPRTCT
jgi:hypothetical protein